MSPPRHPRRSRSSGTSTCSMVRSRLVRPFTTSARCMASPGAMMGSDSLGTVTLALFGLAMRGIVGLFSGEEAPDSTVQPMLNDAERERALAQIQGHRTVLEATIEQRGRTVALELVVPPSTSSTSAGPVHYH